MADRDDRAAEPPPMDPEQARGILDSLLSDLPGVVYRCRNDREWTMLGLTANAEALTGHPPADLLRNSRLSWAELIHPDDREPVWTVVQESVEDDSPFRVTYRIRTRSGKERWVLEQGRAVEENGERILTGYIQDISGPFVRRLSETENRFERTRRELRALELLQEITAIGNRTHILERALQAAVPLICESLGFPLGHAFVPGREEGDLRLAGVWYLDGEAADLEGFRSITEEGGWDQEESLPARVLRTGSAEWVEDVKDDPAFPRLDPSDPSPVRSGVSVPILSGERPVGVLEFYSVAERTRDPELEELLEQVGVQLGRVWEREEAREQVAETTRLLRQTLSSMGEAVFVVGTDESRKISEANEAAERIFGYARHELIGESTEKLHSDRDSFERFGREGEKALRREGTFHAQLPMRRKDGTIFAAEQTVTLVDPEKGLEGGVVSVVRDVSGRTEVEARLGESEERFRQIAEHIDAVFWITTPRKDVMEYVSPAYRAVTGYPPEELYEDARRWVEHIHPEDRDRVLRALPKQVEGSYEQEYRIVRADGEIRWLWDRAFPVQDEKGEVHRIIGVAEDITEQKALGEQLRHSQKMEGVGRPAGGIAHDFNNLLTVIRGQSDLLEMDLKPDSPLLAEVSVLRDAADRAADLTSKLLAFSREQVLRPRILDLNEIVKGMDGLLRRVLGEDLRIETDLAEALPPVRLDPGQMEHVLMNLAVNGRDAMPRGGTLRLSTSVEEETPKGVTAVPGLEEGPAVRLDVADTGIGMDDETRQRAFDPFFTTKQEGGGTGLGLAMVYGTVQQSGGHIEIKSEPGKGSLFTLRFPPARGEVEAPVRRVRARFESRELSGRVLAIEDDADVRAVIHRILTRGGLEVRTAADAENGIRILAEEEGRIDLVLTDLVLPRMSGRELMNLIRERWPTLPVIVMSGYAEGEIGSRKDLSSEIAFIQKPFTPAALLQAVGEELERAGPQDDPS